MMFLASTKLAQEIIREYYPDDYIFTKREQIDLYEGIGRKIFSVHWSWKIPEKVLKNNDWTIGFHMTDLPWGGGSFAYEKLVVANERDRAVCL